MARFQRIKTSGKGHFVVFRGRRHYLSEFLRIQNNKLFDGYKTLSNSSSLVIKLSDCGEGAKLSLI